MLKLLKCVKSHINSHDGFKRYKLCLFMLRKWCFYHIKMHLTYEDYLTEMMLRNFYISSLYYRSME